MMQLVEFVIRLLYKCNQYICVIPADGLTTKEEQPEDRLQPPKVGVLELDCNQLRLDWRIPGTASGPFHNNCWKTTNVKKQIKDCSLFCQKCPSKNWIQ